MKRYLSIFLALLLCVSLIAGCTQNGDPTDPETSPTPGGTSGDPSPDETPVAEGIGHKDPKHYTFNDYIGVFGTDWSPHSWETDADRLVLQYITSGLYEFKFNDDMTTGELFPMMASAEPIDVTGSLTAEQKEQYGIPADATESYAYQYPLRDNITFSDGTPINAQTFVDSLKLLLDPKRQNGRAAEQRSGETPIAGANGYFNQGTVSCVAADADSDISDGVFFSMSNMTTWLGMSFNEGLAAGYGAYFTGPDGTDYAAKWDTFAKDNGGYNLFGFFKLPEDALAEFEADWTVIANTFGGGAEGEWKEFAFVAGESYMDPKYSDFNNVGVIADDEFTVTFVYAVPVSPFNAKYYQTSTWVVHTGLYEQLSKTEGDLLTTSYMTGVDSTVSFGPYTLVSYEAEKEMRFERNESWFGYEMEEMNGCYQPDVYRVTMIKEQSTALLSFLKGELDKTAMVATDLVDYGTSDYLQVMEDTYLYRFFYNLGAEILKTLDSDDSSNSNTVAMLNKNFRLGISMAIDRNEHTKITNRIPAFALVSGLYTYDYEGEMADGTKYRYRDLDAAKEAILNIYGIKYGEGTEYPTLDIAVDSITGYDPGYAKELMKAAFDELSAGAPDNGFDPSKPVVIRVGYAPEVISPTALAVEAELNAKFAAAIEGSGFAGFKFEFIVDKDRYGAVTEGRVAASYGAICGARQDPWGISRGFLDPEYSIYLGANIPNDTVEITAMFDGTTESTQTKSLYDWYVALTGDYLYSPIELKADILGALESYYLQQGYTTPIEVLVTTSMRSIRCEYPLDEADPIMEFGGLAYVNMTMDDTEWAEYINGNISNGALPYK